MARTNRAEPLYWLHQVEGIDLPTAQKITLMMADPDQNHRDVQATYPHLWGKIDKAYEALVEVAFDC